MQNWSFLIRTCISCQQDTTKLPTPFDLIANDDSGTPRSNQTNAKAHQPLVQQLERYWDNNWETLPGMWRRDSFLPSEWLLLSIIRILIFYYTNHLISSACYEIENLQRVKMINVALKTMDFVLKMMNFALKTMDFVLKMMNFALKTMIL